jgi:hypothetical protein
LLFLACLAAQLYLVFVKSFNWDEFLHFSLLYRLREGTELQPFQVFGFRLLWWAPDVASNLADQMLAARLFAWVAHLFTLFMIYCAARRFSNATNSFFAAFAYLAAGYVFNQSFAIRADPLVTATLMAALCLFVRGKFNLFEAIAIGALVGLAGMMTVKAILYSPCFAGLAWLKLHEAPTRPEFIAKLVIAAIAALLSFGSIYLFNTWNFPEAAPSSHSVSSVSFFLRWITADMHYWRFVVEELILGIVFFAAVAFAPFAWKKAGLKTDEKVALAGLMLPLAALVFYRNTFPYFFTFLLAPVAVVIAPSLGLVRARFGNAFLAFVLAAVPLALAVLEPRDVIRSQRALIDYVHREFPEKTGYLDYSGMIADYPRIMNYLTTGNGIRHYREQGEAVVAREIDRGNVPFIMANRDSVLAALEGRTRPLALLPEDIAAMHGNYVRQWGVLWREGKQIPAGSGDFAFQLRRGGAFTLAGGPLTIDGKLLTHGMQAKLDAGVHSATGRRTSPSTLWRGDRLPTTPPSVPADIVFTEF